MPAKEVTVYALTTCAHCNAVKRLLNENAIACEWIDIDLLPEQEQEDFFAHITPYNPKKSFPVVIIGNTAIVGYQRERIARELGIKHES